MVAIFPKLCLWRRSLCSNLGGIGLEKLYRATLSEFPHSSDVCAVADCAGHDYDHDAITDHSSAGCSGLNCFEIIEEKSSKNET